MSGQTIERIEVAHRVMLAAVRAQTRRYETALRARVPVEEFRNCANCTKADVLDGTCLWCGHADPVDR